MFFIFFSLLFSEFLFDFNLFYVSFSFSNYFIWVICQWNISSKLVRIVARAEFLIERFLSCFLVLVLLNSYFKGNSSK